VHHSSRGVAVITDGMWLPQPHQVCFSIEQVGLAEWEKGEREGGRGRRRRGGGREGQRGAWGGNGRRGKGGRGGREGGKRGEGEDERQVVQVDFLHILDCSGRGGGFVLVVWVGEIGFGLVRLVRLVVW